MRTKQLKFLERLLLALFFTSFLSALNAQYIEVPLERKIQNAPFIFEGEVISSQSFMPEEQKIIYTSHVIKISKILKGDFPNDEVEIITVGGSVNGLRLDVTNNLMLHDGWEGIFFCRNTVRPSLNRSNSNVALRVYEGEQGFIRYQNHFGSTTAKTVFHHYENVETELLSVIEQKTRKRERVNPNKREKALLEWISQKSYGNTSRNGMKTGIEYEFANPEITGQNDEYFEFDIEVSTFANTFLFGNSEIYLEYDPNVWGLNMVANGKITATKETVILSSDYSLTIGDKTASKLKLAINSINNPNNPFSLTPNQEELCHLKLDISNLLSVSPSIFFDETAMQGESEYYQNGNFYDFLNVVAADSMIQSWNSFLPPVIDTIYPEIITAGTFDTLYIEGQNFDNPQGKIFFGNSDFPYGTQIDVEAEDIDVVFWSNNLIKVILPSSNTSNESVGSGPISVQNTSSPNNPAISQGELIIDYSIRNIRDSATKKALLPILIAPSDTFKFNLHNSVSLLSDTANTIRENLKQWRCVSGINWKLSDIAVSDTSFFDGINSIYFTKDTSILDKYSGYGVTFIYSRTGGTFTVNECTYNNNKYIYVSEIDVYFNGFSNQFDYFITNDANLTDTTKVDFWTTSLHELGHAHLLKHVNADYDATLFTAAFKDRVQRDIDIYSADGANWIIDSIFIISPFCGGSISENKFGCTTSTLELVEENNIGLYPNPTSGNLILEVNALSGNTSYITIIDIYGRVLSQEKIILNNGTNKINIDGSLLSNGMYLINIQIDNKSTTLKFIKH
jgi:hypothetical protein